jgi:hypothetical protein
VRAIRAAISSSPASAVANEDDASAERARSSNGERALTRAASAPQNEEGAPGLTEN